MAVSGRSTNVEIDGEEYSILLQPPDESSVVLAERKALDSSLDLKQLVLDMGRVGAFIRIAYNAIVAGGFGKPELANLQNQVTRLGFDITKLCDKSASTVNRFSTASRTIIMTLKCSYQNLLDGLEDMAIDDLSSMSKLADQMSVAASELQKEFEKQQEKVMETLDNTITTKAKEEEELEKKKAKQLELEMNKKAAEKKMKESASREAEAKKERKEYEKKEDATIGKKKGFFDKLVNGVSDMLPVGGEMIKTLLGTDEDPKEEAAQWKERSLKKLDEETKARDERYKYLNDLNESLVGLEMVKEGQSQTDMAVKCLQKAGGALKNLASTMQRAAQFWSDLSIYCNALANDHIRDAIETGMRRKTEEQRYKVWTSTSFKIKAVTYYGKWVALNGMCNEYMASIKETRADLYKYIVENPDHDEAQKRLPDLVKNFKSDLDKAQKAIQDQNFEAQKEIEKLKVSPLPIDGE